MSGSGTTVLASGGGAAAGAWFGLWVLTIVIGIVAYSNMPKLAAMDIKANNARKAILIAGFLPCFGINLISMFFFYLLYKFHARGAAPNQQLQERLNQTFDSPPASAPRRDAGTQSQSDNPFL